MKESGFGEEKPAGNRKSKNLEILTSSREWASSSAAESQTGETRIGPARGPKGRGLPSENATVREAAWRGKTDRPGEKNKGKQHRR